jgi:aspartyl protease family protein
VCEIGGVTGVNMSNGEGPWSEPRPPRTNHRWRIWLWLGLLAAFAAGVWGLAKLFPGHVADQGWLFPARAFAILVLVSSGLLAPGRLPLGRAARYVGVWAGLIAVLVLGYVFRADLADLGLRIRSQLIPAYAVQTAPGVLALSQSNDGGYYAVGKMNGQPVSFMVDTGASDVVLSPADARRLGIDTAALKYDDIHETANGAGHGARFVVQSLSIGPIQFRDLPVSINQTDMSQSLLGMTFLKRLDSFEFKQGRLLLRFHGP